MGLKTNNYTIRDLGITLPTAYALLGELKIVKSRVTAVFFIQTDREKAKTLNPIKKLTVSFEFNRNENPVESAYNLIKGKTFVDDIDTETGELVKVEKEMPLYGWEDDRT